MNILITGGASGLGEAVTRELAGEKTHHVFFTYCRSRESAQKLEAEFLNTTAIHCDFTSRVDIDVLFEQMKAMELDALINNAITGIDLKHFHETSPKLFLERFEKNVLPVIAITSRAIAIFRKRGKGKIITILTSYLSEKPPLGLSSYVAEKAYLASLSKSWAAENARFHITANTISPSFMSTRLTNNIDPRLFAKEAKSALDPKKVARTIRDLLKENRELSGTDIAVQIA